MKERQIFGSPGTPAARYDGWSTRSVHVPMRDGVKLAADILLPKGLAPEARVPALVSQTRYWRSPELRAPFKWFLEPCSLNAYVKDLVPFFTGQGSVLIRKGHRIRILIAGHDAGTFVRIPAEGTPTIAIARNRERPSCLDLPVRERS
jgi:predicted acyl esterase